MLPMISQIADSLKHITSKKKKKDPRKGKISTHAINVNSPKFSRLRGSHRISRGKYIGERDRNPCRHIAPPDNEEGGLQVVTSVRNIACIEIKKPKKIFHRRSKRIINFHKTSYSGLKTAKASFNRVII